MNKIKKWIKDHKERIITGISVAALCGISAAIGHKFGVSEGYEEYTNELWSRLSMPEKVRLAKDAGADIKGFEHLLNEYVE